MAVALYGLAILGMYDFGYDPATSFLCRTIELNGWKSAGDGGYEFKRDLDGVEYFFSVDSMTESELGADEFRRATLVANAFWVRVHGGVYGSAVGLRDPAMEFDPGDARMAIGRQKLSALRRAWIRTDDASQKEGSSRSTYKEIKVPVAINRLANESAGSYVPTYFAFPIKPPDPEVSYVIALGSIFLDGHRTLLPSVGSCYTPGHWKSHPIY